MRPEVEVLVVQHDGTLIPLEDEYGPISAVGEGWATAILNRIEKLIR